MNKKMFVLIVILMSISLIGIVSVQYFWVQNAIKTNDKQFSDDVSYALSKVADNIYSREQQESYERFKQILDTTDAKEIQIEGYLQTFLYERYNPENNTTYRYTTSLLEDNYKVPSDFFEQDTTVLKRIFSQDEITEIRSAQIDTDLQREQEVKTRKVYKELTSAEREWLKASIDYQNDSIPINRRTNRNEIEVNIEKELKNRGIDTDFRFAVYDGDFPTSVKSGYFRLEKNRSYYVSLFNNDKYKLVVNFPQKNRLILESVGRILMLSIFFIVIIVIVFTSSLYQMIKQRKISEIKTDFINNMTHEFKTPIATINLATDAIRNPKIIEDQEKVLRYVKMINDENVRMHQQVENVLRISKLEKNQLDITKDEVDFQDIIDDAIHHVELLVGDRQGQIKTHFEALQTEVYGNEFHLTNMCVNILENAIKYSPDAPKIDVYTLNEGNQFVLIVKDQGIGMSKTVQKNIFDKFYRESGGNIHNVKGHGLGLSYVKQIITRHNGSIFVESEKGKGSTFTIKLELI
ncbi:HAMP domain-containing histidine kinase [Flavobacteriaceae bacterium]|nr:HAMP domain-containing histidine kinase [Flavobacteriaceae bacterium]